jgi:alkylation response protein AidB-like acyl-CoA dehydrogenase
MAKAETAAQTAGEDVRPSVDELVERARALVPALRERAPLAEELRRLPDETAQDFKDAGIVRMGTPTKFGGYGYGLDAIAEVTQPIGLACGASAWMGSFWPAHNHTVGWFSEEAQAEYWADGPDTLSSTAGAVVEWESTPVDGGIRITGKHKFSSGLDHADWVFLSSPNENLLIPRSDYTIEDDWYVSGLKGTGSKSFRYENVFVPTHRIITHEQLGAGAYPGREVYADDPWFQVPNPYPLLLPHAILAAVVSIAGGFLSAFDDRVRTRRDSLSMEPAIERSLVQHRYAESSVEHEVALMLLRSNLAEIHANPGMGLQDRARIRRNTTYANHICSRLVDRLVSQGDSSALYESNHTHRLARDVRAGTLQFALGWDETAIQYSRVHWGLPPQTYLV